MLNKTTLLFLVILIEGYVVLACELLGIRLLVPFVGSGVETTAIIISGVLLPLAVGYHVGGHRYVKAYRRAKSKKLFKNSIRDILMRNILVALIFLSFGLTHVIVESVFYVMNEVGITHRLPQTFLYVMLFLVTPIYLLGQTVPLASHYFSKRKLSAITGRMLFFSTIGSFLGSLFSTLVLMTYLGVHNTVTITVALLGLLALLVAGRRRRFMLLVCLIFVFFTFVFNNPWTLRAIGVVGNNAYNMVRLIPVPDTKDVMVFINNAYSSRFTLLPQNRFPHVKYIEQNLIAMLNSQKRGPLDILVLGAGAFDIGRFDNYNNFLYIDIDKELKEIAERELLKNKLASNKKFVAQSARSFIIHDKAKYDMIVIDVYTRNVSMPMEAITQEFYRDIKNHLKPDGIVAANIVARAAFDDRFSVRFDNTFGSVFPNRMRQLMPFIDVMTAVEKEGAYNGLRNALYIYHHTEAAQDRSIYTDDKNNYSMDVE
ncbi:MAG: hypothetical protein EOM37_02450 [Proteobacteria bacterium]|jgi:predicted membrane-bound spermidine synthase|nr:fused MFS/spermidine synthase [Alphaproteobacteria bacterium]NCC02897.1 hypothetical protein [Pseudomonadota bacterium]